MEAISAAVSLPKYRPRLRRVLMPGTLLTDIRLTKSPERFSILNPKPGCT